MSGDLSKAAGPFAAIGAVLLCIPCLLVPAVAVLLSAGAFAAIGGWASNNALGFGLGLGAAIAAALFAAFFATRSRRRGAACAPGNAEESVILDRRAHQE